MRPRRRAGMVYGCGLRRCLIIFAPHTLVLDRRTRTCRAPSPRLILRRSKNFTSGAAISFTSSGPIVADRSRHHRTPDPTPGAADAGPRQRGHPHGGERRPHNAPPLLPPAPAHPFAPPAAADAPNSGEEGETGGGEARPGKRTGRRSEADGAERGAAVAQRTPRRGENPAHGTPQRADRWRPGGDTTFPWYGTKASTTPRGQEPGRCFDIPWTGIQPKTDALGTLSFPR